MLVCDCLQRRTRGLNSSKCWRSIRWYRLVARTRPDKHICIWCCGCEGICGGGRRLRGLRAVYDLNVTVCRSWLRLVLAHAGIRRKWMIIDILRPRRIGTRLRGEIDYCRIFLLLWTFGSREGRFATE
jgi:hypothetical protein